MMKFMQMLVSLVLVSTIQFGKTRGGGGGYAEASLVISGLVDHPYYSVLELTACSPIANFNAYRLDQSKDGTCATTVPDEHCIPMHGNDLPNIPYGAQIYVASGLSLQAFAAYFGFTPRYFVYNANLAVYGDWTYYLYDDKGMVDQYDNAQVSGLSFDKGWARRKEHYSATPSGDLTHAADWIISLGAYASFPQNNAAASPPIFFGQYSCSVPVSTPYPAPSPMVSKPSPTWFDSPIWFP